MSVKTRPGKNMVILVVVGSMASPKSGIQLYEAIREWMTNGFVHICVDLLLARDFGAPALYALMQAQIDARHVGGTLCLDHAERAAVDLMYSVKMLTTFDIAS
jgi:hypothetical protein